MRSGLTLLTTLASALVLAACNMAADAQENGGGGGPVTQRSYQLSGFDAIGAAGAQDVTVEVGPAFSVRAEGEAEMLDRLDIKVEEGTLKIGHKKNGNWSLGLGRNRPRTRVFVTLPALRGASIAGSGDMRIDRVEGSAFKAAIAGAGDMQIGRMQVGEAQFSIAGSGDIKAAGAAQRSSASIAGSGNIDAADLQSRAAKISIVGSGDVRIHASETADVSIAGSGDVEISGSPKCTVNKRGSGDVRCVA